MQNEVMHVILVGLGAVSGSWIKAIQASDVVDIAACVEVDADRAETQMRKFKLKNVPLFTSLEDALTSVKAEGVIDLTPPSLRLDHARQAFDAGLPVLAEKPLSDTIESAEAIAQLADERGMTFVVGQNYRYGNVIQTAKKLLASGELGQIGAISAHFYKVTYLPGFHMQLSDVLLQDMSIHHFDLMRFFLDENPVSVFARSYNPPYSWHRGNASVSASIRFESGVVATYQGSWAATGQETPWNGHWRFDCEKGVLVIEDDTITVERFPGLEQRDRDPVIETPDIVGQERNQRDYLVQEFYDTVRAGKQPTTIAQDNIHSLRMVFDAIKSSRTGQPVERSAYVPRGLV